MSRAGLILAVLATLSGCGSSDRESLDNCVSRFKKDLPTIGSKVGKMQFDFTYQLTRSDKTVDEAAAKRARLTTTAGAANDQMIKKFLGGRVYPSGDYLFASNIVLQRVPGPVADWDTALATGCRNAPLGSRLYNVNAFPIAAGSGSS